MRFFKKVYYFLFVDDLLGSQANPAPAMVESLKTRLVRDLSRLTLLSYVLLVFNPVMPLVTDKLAHTFWAKYHLLTVHEVNGKFHVHIELDKAAKQAGKEQSSGTGKFMTEFCNHPITVNNSNFQPCTLTGRYYTPYKLYLPVAHLDVDYQPPEA